MELLFLTFLGLFGIAAFIAFLFSTLFLAIYSAFKVSSFTFIQFSQKETYVNRVIDVVSTITTLSVTFILYMGFNLSSATSFGIGFLCTIPAIIYWYFWRPTFLNQPVNFI